MISVVICTYNSPNLIEKCVNSILSQKGLDEKVEILFLDGGSDRETLELLKNFSRIKDKIFSMRVIENKNKVAEGKYNGKWLRFNESEGDIVGFIDQDNELIREDVFKKIRYLMRKEKDCFGFAHRLCLDQNENWVNRAISLIGTDPILAYRSLDYLSSIGKVKGLQKDGYRIVEIPSEETIITGGNCFFYNRSDLEKIGGYTQDVENIYLLNRIGRNKIILLDESTTNHRAISGLLSFFVKKKGYGKGYSSKKKEFSYFPKTALERRSFIINFCKILFVFPLIAEKFFLSIKHKKIEHFFTLPLYYLSFFAYSIGFVENFLKSRKQSNRL